MSDENADEDLELPRLTREQLRSLAKVPSKGRYKRPDGLTDNAEMLRRDAQG